MDEIKALAMLNAEGGIRFGNEVTEFPVNPKNGMSCIKDGMLWVYLTYQGVTTWYPLVKLDKIYVHTQTVAGTEWIVNHNMNSEVFVSTVIINDTVVGAETTVIDANTIKVRPGVNTSGKAIFMFDVSTGGEVITQPYPVSGGLNEAGNLILDLSDGSSIDLGAMADPNATAGGGGGLGAWSQVTYLNATAGQSYVKQFNTPDANLLRNIVVWRFVPGTDGVQTEVAATFDSVEASDFQTTPGVVFDGTMHLGDIVETSAATYERTLTDGAVFSTVVDFTQFDTLKSLTMY